VRRGHYWASGPGTVTSEPCPEPPRPPGQQYHHGQHAQPRSQGNTGTEVTWMAQLDPPNGHTFFLELDSAPHPQRPGCLSRVCPFCQARKEAVVGMLHCGPSRDPTSSWSPSQLSAACPGVCSWHLRYRSHRRSCGDRGETLWLPTSGISFRVFVPHLSQLLGAHLPSWAPCTVPPHHHLHRSPGIVH
jgi:hypothetical protein